MLREPLLKRRDALTELLRLLCKRPSVIEPSQMVMAPAHEMIRSVTEGCLLPKK
jgi:hypothetical protein